MTYGRVVALDILGLPELRKDVLREDLSKFNTHLVVGVDAPDDTLSEDLVLVERDERAERRGCEHREDDAVTWAVALEDLGLDQSVGRVRRELLQNVEKCTNQSSRSWLERAESRTARTRSEEHTSEPSHSGESRMPSSA